MQGCHGDPECPSVSFLTPVRSVREVEVRCVEALGQAGDGHAQCGREPGDVPEIGEGSALFDTVDVSTGHPRPSRELGHGHVPRLTEATDVLSEARREAPVCRIIVAGMVHTNGVARHCPAVEVPIRVSSQPRADGVVTTLSS